jgi:hypothetical protein
MCPNILILQKLQEYVNMNDQVSYKKAEGHEKHREKGYKKRDYNKNSFPK